MSNIPVSEYGRYQSFCQQYHNESCQKSVQTPIKTKNIWHHNKKHKIIQSSTKTQINYTITNWRVSLSKICHEWPNNAVTHECIILRV